MENLGKEGVCDVLRALLLVVDERLQLGRQLVSHARYNLRGLELRLREILE